MSDSEELAALKLVTPPVTELSEKNASCSTPSSCLSPVGNDRAHRHSKYYIKEDMVIFRVEDSLYKTHKYFFTWESGFFQDMFSLPQPCEESKPADGSTDETAINLPGVTCVEFEALLDFFYFRQSIQDDVLPLRRWTALLSIATRFQFDKIRNRAIKEIDKYEPSIDPVDKILLADKYSVTEWLSPSYCILCQRAEALTEVEAQKLGAVTTCRVARAREDVRKQFLERYTSNNVSFDAESVKVVITRIFWPEPKVGKRMKKSSAWGA